MSERYFRVKLKKREFRQDIHLLGVFISSFYELSKVMGEWWVGGGCTAQWANQRDQRYHVVFWLFSLVYHFQP